MKDLNLTDSDSFGKIKSELVEFQKEIFKEFKTIGEQIVEDEFDYIKNTIESKHGKKYSVIINKTSDGWVIFPDKADQAVLMEFGLNFPIWRQLYSTYKKNEK